MASKRDIQSEIQQKRELLEALTAVIDVQASVQRFEDFCPKVLNLQPANHHLALIHRLEKLHTGELHAVLAAMPPGAAKSSYTSFAYPAWLLSVNPKLRIILASHTHELAVEWSRKVRDLIATPEFKKYSSTKVDPKIQAADRWKTTAGGGILAAGTGKSILGFRADHIICDDLVSGYEMASSDTQLQKLGRWLFEDLLTRLEAGGRVAHIAQRLHENDSHGQLQRYFESIPELDVEVLRLPLIAELDDPLGRDPGDQLWPEHLDEAYVARARSNEVRFQTLYQQTPLSGWGTWISREDIQVYAA